jgi:curved DNA-binding protein CbpA
MSAQQKDLYAILGVPRHATQGPISRAYRTLLRRYHPDTRAPDPKTSVSSDAALQQVVAAYAVLRDSNRRAAYDRQTTPHIRTRVRTPPTQTAAALRHDMQPPIRAGPVRWDPA